MNCLFFPTAKENGYNCVYIDSTRPTLNIVSLGITYVINT